MDADLGAWPAKAMHQPGGHRTGSYANRARAATLEVTRINLLGSCERSRKGDLRSRQDGAIIELNCFFASPQLSSHT